MNRSSAFLFLALLLRLHVTSAAAQEHRLAGDPPIAWWVVGEPRPGRTVIVIHGGPAVTHDYLRPEWDALAPVARVVYYDQRGCGRSGEHASYGWKDHVSDLRRLIAQVAGDEPVVLAGSSWGSMLAVYYAAEHPEDVRALVLSGIPWGSMPELRGTLLGTAPGKFFEAVLARVDSTLPPASGFVRSARQLPPFMAESVADDTDRANENRRRMMAELAPRFRGDCEETRLLTGRSLGSAPRMRRLYTLGIPTLLFPDDRYGKEFSAAAADPENLGDLTIVEGGGHDPWFEHTDLFFDLVLSFLDRVLGSSSSPPA